MLASSPPQPSAIAWPSRHLNPAGWPRGVRPADRWLAAFGQDDHCTLDILGLAAVGAWWQDLCDRWMGWRLDTGTPLPLNWNRSRPTIRSSALWLWWRAWVGSAGSMPRWCLTARLRAPQPLRLYVRSTSWVVMDRRRAGARRPSRHGGGLRPSGRQLAADGEHASMPVFSRRRSDGWQDLCDWWQPSGLGKLSLRVRPAGRRLGVIG